MATEEGIVTALGDDTAWVETTPREACNHCASKDSCEVVGQKRKVEVINTTNARVGDKVLITIKTASLLKATFLLYLFPILCMLAGAAAGHYGAYLFGLTPAAGAPIAGFSCLFAAFIYVRLKGNRLSEQTRFKPRISRILYRRPREHAERVRSDLKPI